MAKATQFIITLTTQYEENYGAHAWDGKGECPQYWKMKGGHEYIAKKISVAEATDKAFVEQIVEDYKPYVERSTHYDSEYVIDWNIESEAQFNARHKAEEEEYKPYKYNWPMTVDALLEWQAEAEAS